MIDKKIKQKILDVIIFSIIIIAFVIIITFTQNQNSQTPMHIQFTCESPVVNELFGKKLDFAIQMNLTQEQASRPTDTFSDVCADLVNNTGIGLCIHMTDNSHYQVQMKMGNMTEPSGGYFNCSSNYTKWSQVQ